MNKTKTEKIVLITKQSTSYQSVGTNLVGFELSEYHNHAIIRTEYFKWEDPWDDGGFWCPTGTEYEIYQGNANLNDQETQELITFLKINNIKYDVEKAIIEELKELELEESR